MADQSLSAAVTTTTTEEKPPHSSLASQIQDEDKRKLEREHDDAAKQDVQNSQPPPPGSSVQVVVRVRPMLPHESGTTSCVQVSASSETGPPNVLCIGGKSGPKFTFDHVFDPQATQYKVFSSRVQTLVDNCLEGYNATCLAYGQTGSGKTHTIMGPSHSTGVVQDEVHQGVIPRAIRTIFQTLNGWKQERNVRDDSIRRQLFDDPMNDDHGNGDNDEENENDMRNIDNDDDVTPAYDYEVKVQFLEVYGEDIHDLLATSTSKSKLTIRDIGMDEPEVLGATQHTVASADEALLCLTRGMLRRVTGSTAMNKTSSRSHAILSLLIEQSSVIQDSDGDDGATEVAAPVGSSPGDKLQHMQRKRSKFNFVDLAGSERQKRTQASGQRLKEGIDINKGLLVLGNVISALGDPNRVGKTFVPYRDSKLTRLLKGSLGGNHKTLMIACASPSNSNMEETLNCLRYANRAKNIQNHAVVNVDATTRLVKELRGKVRLLARDILRIRNGKGESQISVEVLESLANGEEAPVSGAVPQSVGRVTPRISRTTVDPYQASPSPVTTLQHQHDLPASDERMCVLEAEKEMYRLQLEACSSDITSTSGTTSRGIQNVFQKRATEYEIEIATLKNTLRRYQKTRPQQSPGLSDRTNLSATKDQHHQYPYIPNLPPKTPDNATIQHPILQHRSESPELSRLRAQMHGSMSQGDQIDAEVVAAEQAEQALTELYLPNEDSKEEIETDNEEEDDLAESSTPGHQQMEVDLYELSSSIVAKEELIEKLQASHDKYEAMRGFYESRLKEMGDLLDIKERESEKLAEELKHSGSDSDVSKALQIKLRDKQSQIADLKRKQRDLSKLTSVVNQNQSQIIRLRHDVLDMKHKKVLLQKQITEERKHHMQEVNRLKKMSMQKDRQMTKLQRQSDSNAHEAHKAKLVAKTRLDQVSQLRSRNKEVEKALRLRAVKHGVMKTAGYDSVLTGRAAASTPRRSENNQKTRGQGGSDPTAAFRDFFDDKITILSKREALAEKLAHEWEDHLELATKRSEILESVDGGNGSNEEIISVESQIRSKEERIRQLASRLGKRVVEIDHRAEQNSFLFDTKFSEICPSKFRNVGVVADAITQNMLSCFGPISTNVKIPVAAFAPLPVPHRGVLDPLAATRNAIKVLFGMVVRERRRVAKLARTASTLDKKVQETESEVIAKDLVFQAYAKEKQEEITSLVQTQQEHILSLMEMVRQESPEKSDDTIDFDRASIEQSSSSSSAEAEFPSNPKLLVLANERIATLERQVGELHVSNRSLLRDSRQVKQLNASLIMAQQECKSHQAEIVRLKSTLNDILNGQNDSEGMTAIVLDALKQSLDNECKEESLQRHTHDHHRVAKPGRVIEVTSSNENEEEDPAWADEIMADLAVIAQGKMPLSLMEDPAAKGMDESRKVSSVFDRLSNPKAFTGVQKQRISRRPQDRSSDANTTSSSPTQLPVSAKGTDRARQQVSQARERPTSITMKTTTPSRKKSVTPRKNAIDRSQAISGMTPDGSGVDDDVVNRGGPNRKTTPGKSSYRGKKNGHGQLNVFERLTKTTTQAYAPKQHKNIAEELLGDILDDVDATTTASTTEADPKPVHPAPEFARADEYAKQDVFERLTKTTTQSYATKTHKNIADEMLGDILDKSESSDTSGVGDDHARNNMHHSGFSRVDEYAKQNVFERLTKTTTQSYAVRQQKGNTDELMNNAVLESKS